MRVAALILGLMAGVFALASPFVFKTNLMAPYLEHWQALVDTRSAVLVWYALPVAAVLGALIAVVLPGFAALFLAAAAFGWAAIAFSTPELMHPGVLGAAGFATLAAISAQISGELTIRRRRQQRREDRAEAQAEFDDGEIEREAALRLDPTLMPRDSAPPPPRRAIPLTLDDVTVTERPAPPPPPLEEPEPASMPPPRETRRWDDAFRPNPRVARRSVGFQWDEHDDPAVDLDNGRPRQGPRLEPRNPPERAERVEFVARPAPPPPPPPSRREVQPEPVPDRWIEPEIRQAPAPHRSRPLRRRGSILVPALAGVGAVLLVGLLLGGGYFAYREGYLDPVIAAVGPRDPEPIATADASPEPEAATPAELADIPPPPAPVAVPQATTPAAPAPSAASPVATLPTVLPSTPTAASAAEASYEDPFAYCAAVGTVDYPDGRYRGPSVIPAMTEILRAPGNAATDRVHWRCANGRVLACSSYVGPICDMTPTVQEMRAYCERNPNITPLFAPHGIWSCVEGKPELPPDANWTVDDRGFMPRAWIAVRAPDTPNG